MKRVVDLIVIDTKDDGLVDLVLCRDGEDHLLGTGLDVVLISTLRALCNGEHTGGLDGDIDPKGLPGQLCRVAEGEDGNLLAIDDDGILSSLNTLVIYSEGGVVFQKMGEGLRIGQVVDTDDLDGFVFEGNLEDVAADSSEAINCDFHSLFSSRNLFVYR